PSGCARRGPPPLPFLPFNFPAYAIRKPLQKLYVVFSAGDHPLHEVFNSFRHNGGVALENHCRFEALCAASSARVVGSTWRG
ncbi:hypothetical protein RA278_29365, partial [Pseudomonas syringae pv. tagetis]